MKIFGYNFGKDNIADLQIQSSAITPKQELDGSSEYTSTMTNFFTSGLSSDTIPISDEIVLINKYRDLARQPEVQRAVDDIVNEAFTYSEKENPISIDMDNVPKNIANDSLKELIHEEFDYILRLMNFKNDCYQIFKRWYVDGRIYYEKVIDKDNTSDGIKELRYIDPRTIKKIREIKKDKPIGGGYTKPSYVVYYSFNPLGFADKSRNSGIPIAPEAIAYANSGELDPTNSIILSFLQQAIKPFNQYRMMKDSMVVYYHTRAPERRVFNVEIGGMVPAKAEQYLESTIAKFRRNVVYDPSTGETKDDKKFMTMNQDFWFPSREGKGTSVNVLQGGANLSEIQQVVQMYKNELMESLNIPASRYLQDVSNFTLGRTSEITRDEIKFGKFISRLRKRFSTLFEDILGTHLILKNILTVDEWHELKQYITYDFLEDEHFTEMKNAEIWNNRINNFMQIEPYIGRYFSKQWAIRNVLNLSEEDWKEMKKEIDEEIKEDPSMDPNFMMQQNDQSQEQDQQFQYQPPDKNSTLNNNK